MIDDSDRALTFGRLVEEEEEKEEEDEGKTIDEW